MEKTVEKGPINYESEDEVDPCKTKTIHDSVIPRNNAFSVQFLCRKRSFTTKSSKPLLVHKKGHKKI